MRLFDVTYDTRFNIINTEHLSTIEKDFPISLTTNYLYNPLIQKEHSLHLNHLLIESPSHLPRVLIRKDR